MAVRLSIAMGRSSPPVGSRRGRVRLEGSRRPTVSFKAPPLLRTGYAGLRFEVEENEGSLSHDQVEVLVEKP